MKYEYVTCGFDRSKLDYPNDPDPMMAVLGLIDAIHSNPQVFPSTPWIDTTPWDKRREPVFSCRIYDGQLEALKALPWITSVTVTPKPKVNRP